MSLRHMTKIAFRVIFVAAAFCRDCKTWSCRVVYVRTGLKRDGSVMLSSHMCDTTRHDIMRHDRAEDQGTTIF